MAMIADSIINRRNKRLITNLITKHSLNLDGLAVFTEAATGSYRYTPILAALAGASRVFAVAIDSPYGLKEDVKKKILVEAHKNNVKNKIEVIFEKNDYCLGSSDIITNLGVVRPITSQMISLMKPTAVIPLMWEAWELRPDELDLAACIEKGILVMGTNEHDPSLRLFDSIGFQICKLLFEVGMSVYNDKFLLISSGSMGNSIADFFINNNISFDRMLFDKEMQKGYERSVLTRKEVLDNLGQYDGLVIAELCHNVDILSANGIIPTGLLAQCNPLIQIIHTYGSVNKEDILKENLCLYPEEPRPFPYGTVCADYLGVKPVLDLMSAGLKVGEVMARCRLTGRSIEYTIKHTLLHSPADALEPNPY